jgi:hypothetical protein
MIEMLSRVLKLLAGQCQRLIYCFAECSHQRGIPFQESFPLFAGHDQVYLIASGDLELELPVSPWHEQIAGPTLADWLNPHVFCTLKRRDSMRKASSLR